MAKEIIINAQPEQTRIALLENGELVELYIENPEHERTLGNIILGRVRKIMPSIQAAFIDIGQKQDAFLHFSDLTENLPEWLHYLQMDHPNISQVHRHHAHARSLRLRHRPQRPRSGGGEEFEDEEEATALEQAHVAATRLENPDAEAPEGWLMEPGEPLEAEPAPDTNEAPNEASEQAASSRRRRHRGGRRRGRARHRAAEAGIPPEDAPEVEPEAPPLAGEEPVTASTTSQAPPPATRAALPQRIVLAPPQPRPPAAPEAPTPHFEPVPELYTHLRRDQRILVKISKEPISHKGSRVSTDISLAGRFLVLVPMADYVAVSKKIASFKERRRLRALAKSLLPEGFGVIVRTVAEDKNAKALDTDLRLLLEKWHKIEEQLQGKPEPPMVAYEDVNMASSVIRDLFSEDYDRILVDDPRLYRNIKNYVQAVAPDMVQAVQLHQGRQGVFETAKLDRAVAEVFESRVNLPSGGYLYFEQTEAMHVIDVNSGRAGQGMTQEQNSRKVNLEAARIIARQLRLRDIGGIIVVDFIDMRDERNRRKLYEEIRKEFRRDRAVTKVLPMSDFGIMQITRQRLRPSLNTRFGDANGKEAATGVAPSRPALPEPQEAPAPVAPPPAPSRLIDPEQLVRDIEQRLLQLKQQQKPDAVLLTVHPFTAAYLNRKLPSIPTRWWLKHFVRVRVNQDPSLEPTAWKLSLAAKEARPAPAPPRSEAAAPPKATVPPPRPGGERPKPSPARGSESRRPAEGSPGPARRQEPRPQSGSSPHRPGAAPPPKRPEAPPSDANRRGSNPADTPHRRPPPQAKPNVPSQQPPPRPPRTETPSPATPSAEAPRPAPGNAEPRKKAPEPGNSPRNPRNHPRRTPRPPSPDANRETPPGADPSPRPE